MIDAQTIKEFHFVDDDFSLIDIFFRHLKLEIASAIPALNDGKKEAINSAAYELNVMNAYLILQSTHPAMSVVRDIQSGSIPPSWAGRYSTWSRGVSRTGRSRSLFIRLTGSEIPGKTPSGTDPERCEHRSDPSACLQKCADYREILPGNHEPLAQRWFNARPALNQRWDNASRPDLPQPSCARSRTYI